MSKSQAESTYFSTIKPMKPVTIDLDSLPPGDLYVQPKVDGIRGILRLACQPDGILRFSFQTASGKQIPNRFIWESAKQWAIRLYFAMPDARPMLLAGIDGELIVEGKPFQETTSLVMSQTKEGSISFVAFDVAFAVGYFEDRFFGMQKILDTYLSNITPAPLPSRFRVYALYTILVLSKIQIVRTLESEMAAGGEGIIIRQAKARYLFGRATLRNPVITRIKPLEQAEATIAGLFEGETNENPQYIDDLGRAKRSTNAEGMIPNGQLGGFVVTCPLFEKSFRIGTIEGMTEIERIRIWENRHNQDYIGKLITFRYMKLGSTKDAPRQPIGIGFRDPSDLTTY